MQQNLGVRASGFCCDEISKSWPCGLWRRRTLLLATSPWRWKQWGPPNLYYPTVSLHGVITHKTTAWVGLCGGISSFQEYAQKLFKTSQLLHSVLWMWYSAGLRFRWSGVLVQAGAGNFSLHHRVQNGPGAHPDSYPMSTRGSFLGGKATEVWSWPLTSI
jgi:hypothetical protein